MHRIAILLVALGSVAGAAELAGTWHAERTLPNGRKLDVTYVLKTEGNRLTGVMYTPTSVMQVANGEVDGANISFQLRSEFDDSRVMNYKGTLAGDELKLTQLAPPNGQVRRFGNGETTLARVSSATEFVPPPALQRTHRPFTNYHALAPNGMAQTPPMGWNSWNKFHRNIDDKTVREIADAMVRTGMRDAGYVYVNIDDTWEGQRDAQGNIQTNEKFPNMKALADYVHSKGLKLGIYSSPGRKTCAGFDGSYTHEQQDARTWAAWGIDYLKYDWCSAAAVYHRHEMAPAYERMGEALRASGRPIVFSLCQYGEEDVGAWGATVGGNLWRTTGDIQDRWESMSRIGFGQNGREAYAGPGHWNDPDMLEIGNGGMSDTEYRTHMSLWCMLAAPLLAGNDIRNMSDATREILTNREVIALDQDRLGRQGFRVKADGDLETWEKPLAHGTAVALFNRGPAAAKMSVRWSELGIAAPSKVRDLWAHRNVDAAAEYAAEVPSHGVVLLHVE